MAHNQSLRHALSFFRCVAAHMAADGRMSSESVLHLAGRIGAIGRAALSAEPGVDLESLILDELLACAATGDNYTAVGPEIRLNVAAAFLFSLLLHELATNSLKYGALSQPQARVQATWWVGQEPHPRLQPHTELLNFCWRETRVRMLPQAQRGRGFGSDLIEKMVAAELQGDGEMLFSAEGVRCSIAVPLDRALHTR